MDLMLVQHLRLRCPSRGGKDGLLTPPVTDTNVRDIGPTNVDMYE